MEAVKLFSFSAFLLLLHSLSSSTSAASRMENFENAPPELSPNKRWRTEHNPSKKQLQREAHLLSHQQKKIVKAVASGLSVFITGSAGTGKSFFLRHVIRVLKETHGPEHVFVTASTGVAACAIDGQTLHSFAGVGLGEADRKFLFNMVAGNEAACKRWRSAAALVIDEVSMIDGELFDHLESIARNLRHETGNIAWGGIQLVVCGDFFQLPPVNPRNPQKEFAFEADCWGYSFDIQVELLHIYRQSDPRLIELLQGLRRGRRDPNYLSALSERCTERLAASRERELERSVPQIYPRKGDVRRVNEERLRRLGGEIVAYTAIDSGLEPWKRRLGQGIAPEKVELCVGARVMLIKNKEVRCGLVNGAVGIVTGFVESPNVAMEKCDRLVLPRVQFDAGPEMVVEPETWEIVEGKMVLAARSQVPLVLAGALTIHKCQGMTLDCLETDLSRAFGCGMVYVALSRVRTLAGLRLSGFDPTKIAAHPKVLIFHQRLLDGQDRNGISRRTNLR